VIIAQITDTHIRPKGKLLHHMVHTAHYLRRCIAQLEALSPRPDVVIATGDLVDRGKAKEYRRLRKILDRLTIPLFVIPGNHDEREALRDAFGDHGYLPRHGPLQYAVDTLPVRLIGLDTVRCKHPGGELDAERFDWFEAALAAHPRRPTFVFMHHPPFEIGILPVDAQGFRNVERFRAIVERNPQIAVIACGHVHRAASAWIGSTRVTTAPSTAHQLIVSEQAFGVHGIRLEPPGFALHTWSGRAIHTTVRTVEALAVRTVARVV
jgi:3',5'-cyclic AMP phosphodiesterase CpdA